METIKIQYYTSSFGELILGSYRKHLCLCDWKYRAMRNTIDARIKKGLGADFETQTSPILEKAKKQLTEYFEGKRQTFDIPIWLVGTPFQQTVWKALEKIPYGETRSYKSFSKSIANEKTVRAIAAANGANALSIFLPCHRIIGSNGKLVGYAGGLPAKKQLLTLEKAEIVKQTELFS